MMTTTQWITSILAGMFLLAPCAQAEEKEQHRIDRWLASQLETTTSTGAMTEALHRAGEMWDEQMNANYQYLLDKLNAEQKADLQKSQRAWIAFRDAESKVHGILADPEHAGTMGRVDAADAYYELIKSRAQKLAYLERRVRAIHNEEVDQNHADETKIVTTPKRGSQVRKDICDAFRVPMTKEVNGQKIVFVIHRLNVLGDWAFINCALQLANGKEVDWKKAGLIVDPQVDFVENNAAGLLKKDAKGKWSVVESSFNHTDVAWEGWDQKHGLSKKLFE